MKALRTLIGDFLKTKHARVYYELAPEKALMPYIVFDFPTSFASGESDETFVLDIECWDVPGTDSSVNVETIMEAINGDGNIISPSGLDKATLSSLSVIATISLEQRLSIQDEDKRIKRKRYTYTIKAYERSN